MEVISPNSPANVFLSLLLSMTGEQNEVSSEPQLGTDYACEQRPKSLNARIMLRKCGKRVGNTQRK